MINCLKKYYLLILPLLVATSVHSLGAASHSPLTRHVGRDQALRQMGGYDLYENKEKRAGYALVGAVVAAAAFFKASAAIDKPLAQYIALKNRGHDKRTSDEEATMLKLERELTVLKWAVLSSGSLALICLGYGWYQGRLMANSLEVQRHKQVEDLMATVFNGIGSPFAASSINATVWALRGAGEAHVNTALAPVNKEIRTLETVLDRDLPISGAKFQQLRLAAQAESPMAQKALAREQQLYNKIMSGLRLVREQLLTEALTASTREAQEVSRRASREGAVAERSPTDHIIAAVSAVAAQVRQGLGGVLASQCAPRGRAVPVAVAAPEAPSINYNLPFVKAVMQQMFPLENYGKQLAERYQIVAGQPIGAPVAQTSDDIRRRVMGPQQQQQQVAPRAVAVGPVAGVPVEQPLLIGFPPAHLQQPPHAVGSGSSGSVIDAATGGASLAPHAASARRRGAARRAARAASSRRGDAQTGVVSASDSDSDDAATTRKGGAHLAARATGVAAPASAPAGLRAHEGVAAPSAVATVVPSAPPAGGGAAPLPHEGRLSTSAGVTRDAVQQEVPGKGSTAAAVSGSTEEEDNPTA